MKIDNFKLNLEMDCNAKRILKDMKIVRELTSLGERLSQDNKRIMKQPLLDFAYGRVWYKKIELKWWQRIFEIFGKKYPKSKKKLGILYLDDDHIKLLAKCLKIYYQGYNFADNDYYYLTDIEPPENQKDNDNWKVISNDKYWVALNFNIPVWLKEVGDKRKKERQEIIKRKKEERQKIMDIKYANA